MGFYIEKIPTEFNGITMEEADYLADEFLKDEPCNRMWDAMRALRDFYETVISEAVEVKDTADTPQTELSTEEFVEGMKNLKMEVKRMECDRYVVDEAGEKHYGCMGCQTDCPWK